MLKLYFEGSILGILSSLFQPLGHENCLCGVICLTDTVSGIEKLFSKNIVFKWNKRGTVFTSILKTSNEIMCGIGGINKV